MVPPGLWELTVLISSQPCSVTSPQQCEISHGTSIYNTEIGKPFNLGIKDPSIPQSACLANNLISLCLGNSNSTSLLDYSEDLWDEACKARDIACMFIYLNKTIHTQGWKKSNKKCYSDVSFSTWTSIPVSILKGNLLLWILPEMCSTYISICIYMYIHLSFFKWQHITTVVWLLTI